MTTNHAAARVHPWNVRLTLDLDPAGNPIGASLTERRYGEEVTAIVTFTPAPFDTIDEVLHELVHLYWHQVGAQHQLDL